MDSAAPASRGVSGGRPAPGTAGEVLLEYVVAGNAAKATAIDPVTGREATVTGPAGGSREALEQAAIRKLAFLLGKAAGHPG